LLFAKHNRQTDGLHRCSLTRYWLLAFLIPLPSLLNFTTKFVTEKKNHPCLLYLTLQPPSDISPFLRIYYLLI
jgi:hypothetical protein